MPARSRKSTNVKPPRSRERLTHPPSRTLRPTSLVRSAPQRSVRCVVAREGVVIKECGFEVLRRLLPREPDQIALGAECKGPSARRVAMTDGGPPVRIQPAGKQRLLQRVVHFQSKKSIPSRVPSEVNPLAQSGRGG